MTREEFYEEQLKLLGVWEEAFRSLVKDLAKAERRRTRAEKEWSLTAPPGGKPSFLDPHYQIVEKLDGVILTYKEALGLTPKSLRRLRGAVDAPGKKDLIADRLDYIAERVEAYNAPVGLPAAEEDAGND